MKTMHIPQRENVAQNNQAIFDNLEEQLGFVPNLYATYAHSNTALENYLTFTGAETSLTGKEKEVVNLAVSEVNQCNYCLSAHTALGKLSGFTDEQILEFRSGEASFDSKLDALAKLSKNLTENRGFVTQEVKENFFNAGYNEAAFIDTIVQVGQKTISNYVHSATQVPIDFPVAQALKRQ